MRHPSADAPPGGVVASHWLLLAEQAAHTGTLANRRESDSRKDHVGFPWPLQLGIYRVLGSRIQSAEFHVQMRPQSSRGTILPLDPFGLRMVDAGKLTHHP